jgi:hypothetical protein
MWREKGREREEANEFYHTLGEITHCNNFPGISPHSLGWDLKRKLPATSTFSI